MVNQAPIPERLKALRKRMGLSTRALAEAIDVPHTSYAHYESRRFKEPYLPLDIAQKIVGAATRYGLDPAEVLSLAGMDDALLQLHQPRSNGMSEPEAVPYQAEPDEVERTRCFVEAFAPGSENADLWELRGRALDLAGLMPLDVAIVDLNQVVPANGDIVCAQIYHGDSAHTVFRIFDKPFLVPRSTLPDYQRPTLIDERVAIKGKVTGSFRRYR